MENPELVWQVKWDLDGVDETVEVAVRDDSLNSAVIIGGPRDGEELWVPDIDPVLEREVLSEYPSRLSDYRYEQRWGHL